MKKNNNDSKFIDGQQFVADVLASWGITQYSGVTGGGVIHFLKHIAPLNKIPSSDPGFFTFAEYNAGFMPLGYYLASGKIAAAVATTGAATKLLSCGLSDAKYHDIPAVYIVASSGKKTAGFAPLQDTSKYGNNIIEQLNAELPDSVFFLDDHATLAKQLSLAKVQLDNSKPVVLVLDNDVLNAPEEGIEDLPKNRQQVLDEEHYDAFISKFRKSVDGKRLVVLVGEEMDRYPHAADLTTRLSTELKATVIWSMNGGNAVSRENPYGYGYIAFGGNDKALSLYDSLNKDDVLLILGACPDEYTVALKKFTASSTFYLGNIQQAYGMIDNSMQHVAEGDYYQIHGPLDVLVQQLINAAENKPFTNKPAKPAPQNLNDRKIKPPRKGYVNMEDFYKHMDEWWPSKSVIINDVCLAYKDMQYVVQRPNANARLYSLYRGSAMGGAFGISVGAKLAAPADHVFLFAGDGCFRLFSGSLGEVSEMGLVIFVLNNQTLSIVEQGLEKVLPDIPHEYYHAVVNDIDYCGVAKACGWDAERLKPDLSNLDNILAKIKDNKKRSFLVEIPVDPMQELGMNPRLKNL